jgi:hypothetical protein
VEESETERKIEEKKRGDETNSWKRFRLFHSFLFLENGEVFHWGTGPLPDSIIRPIPVLLAEKLKQFRFAAVFPQRFQSSVCSESVQISSSVAIQKNAPQQKEEAKRSNMRFTLENSQPVCSGKKSPCCLLFLRIHFSY